MNRRKRTIKEWVGVAVSCAFLTGGLFFLWSGFSWGRDWDRWVSEEPVRVRLDLSRSEAGQVPFHQTCAIAHAQCVELRAVRPEDTQKLRDNVMRANIRVHVNKGSEFAGHVGALTDDPDSNVVQIERLQPVANGDYIFSFETTGVPELAEVPADLIVRNELCGLEKLPSLVGYVVGGALVLVSGATALAFGVFRSRRLPTAETAIAKPSPPL